MDPEAPAWFRRAIETRPERRTVVVEGCDINYLLWGPPDRPGVVLVHGGAAHAHWWSHIAPMLGEYSVAALDMSGAGDSGRRESYSLDLWSDEVVAVGAHAGFRGKPVVVGHSMGGFVSLNAAARHCEDLAGIVVIDSPVKEPDPEVKEGKHGQSFREPKTYPSREVAAARFRTVPAQDHYEPYVKANVAWHSLTPTEGGWTWKFDPRVFFAPSRRHEATDLLPQINCRVALFRAEHGLVTPTIGEYMYERLGRVAPVIELPTAGHHPMLDVPLLLITGLRTLLSDWDHSAPIHRTEN